MSYLGQGEVALEKFIKKIVDKQIYENRIAEEDKNIYLYGYTLLFEVLINIVIAIIIGIITRRFLMIFVFLCNYIPLRSFCGGWHADRLWKCTIYSNLTLICLIVMYICCSDRFTEVTMILIYAVCMVFVLLYSPMDTKSKVISDKERVKYKKVIITVMFIHTFVLIVSVLYGSKDIEFILMFVYVLQMIMLVPGVINKYTENKA